MQESRTVKFGKILRQAQDDNRLVALIPSSSLSEEAQASAFDCTQAALSSVEWAESKTDQG